MLIKEIDRRKRTYCPKCGFVHFINPAPVVAILIRKDDTILFIKRKVSPAKNQWALPGGFIDDDESPEIAAARELKEETNLESKKMKFIGFYSHYSDMNGPILSIGYSTDSFTGKPCAGDDAIDYKFFPLSKLPPIAFDSHKKLIMDYLNLNKKN
jgi:ADP-ribose pyrophosphatase YjhB (NUDIX family)